MSSPLTYPALRCVLEFLDPARRIHISARNSALQRINASIPHRMDRIVIGEFCVYLNEIKIFNTRNNVIVFEKVWNHEKIEKLVSLDQNAEIMRKLYNYYFGGRKNTILADNAFFTQQSTDIFFPPNLSLTINKLSIHWCDFRKILPYINPISFPLKSFGILDDKPVFLDHPVVQSAETVKIKLVSDSRTTKLPDAHLLRNKNISVDYSDCKIRDIIRMIKHWMTYGKEIGTKFTLTYRGLSNHIVSGLLIELEKFLCNSEGVDKQMFLHKPRFAIKLNSWSKIFVYEIDVKRNYGYAESQLALTVVEN
ncbi:hypothetical protein GCK72_008016 [Caenorhabditis remanei]|uniref:F-box domain-containing protein n=1 Tax=Caenorhabditis remanei TaxID=31234 RepID=A0A6A5HKJ8_CAERE|nr:hypothetical protein GCK72_008016 [Caenorhabditis remanei]KAF1768055.1 hypothetical protein GCK72_008016 [Caenorhabditis remanei]